MIDVGTDSILLHRYIYNIRRVLKCYFLMTPEVLAKLPIRTLDSCMSHT